jgi:hypothetical protein
VEVLRGHQVERAAGELLGQVDAQRGDGATRPLPQRLHGRRGDVDRRHPPAMAGEPQRVAARAAAEVQRGAGGQWAGDLDESRVHACCRGVPAVVLVPEVGGSGLGHAPTMTPTVADGTKTC